MRPFNHDEVELIDKIVYINRVAKVSKGGRRFNFSVVVVVGDGKGSVGMGIGKAKEVPEAIRKGIDRAKKDMVKIPMKGTTIPHRITGRFGASRVMLRPAGKGTGVIAGGPVRAVLEAAGIGDILTKSLGSSNQGNLVKATLQGLRSLIYKEKVMNLRGTI